MHCTNCGYKIDEEIKFCPNCGNKINTPVAKQGPESSVFEFDELIDNISNCDIVGDPQELEQLIVYLKDVEKLINELSEGKEWEKSDIALCRDKFIKVLIKKSKNLAYDLGEQQYAIDLLEEIIEVPSSKETISDLKGAISFLKHNNEEKESENNNREEQKIGSQEYLDNPIKITKEQKRFIESGSWGGAFTGVF